MDGRIGHRIFVADDDILMINIYNRILSPHYSLSFARNGLEALVGIKEVLPDIILLDILMPGMNGFDVLAELKKSESTSLIPTILITSLTNSLDEEKGLSLGAADYITKPFHDGVLKARIKTQINNIKAMKKDDAGFTLKLKREVRFIPYCKLVYVDISGHWLKFHLNDETIKVYASLKDYEDILLSEPRFERCHKSFIINMDYIEAVEVRDVLLTDKTRLPISKSCSGLKKIYVSWVNSK